MAFVCYLDAVFVVIMNCDLTKNQNTLKIITAAKNANKIQTMILDILTILRCLCTKMFLTYSLSAAKSQTANATKQQIKMGIATSLIICLKLIGSITLPNNFLQYNHIYAEPQLNYCFSILLPSSNITNRNKYCARNS